MSEMELLVVRFDQKSGYQYLCLGFLLALISLNTISNVEFEYVFYLIRAVVKSFSVRSLTNILSREYEKTTAAIKNQILKGQKVSKALDK
jgi:hypothetical protein